MGNLTKKNGDDVELKKHVATIHSSNPLSLLQRKISNALLYHAYPELLQKEEHEITIKQLCNIIGYNGNNHSVIKEALKGLISCIIEWNMLDEKTGEEDWTASAIIASANIKGSRCNYSYSPRMRKLLHSPTMYGKINLIVQSKFRSSYGLALYENCVRYKNLPYTKWFELSLFRSLMGVPSDKYLIFRDFKKRVLDKAVEEINNYSDLIIEAEINRQGHKVNSIRFKLKEREKKRWLGMKLKEEGRVELIPTQSTIAEKLSTSYGFTNNQIFSLLEEFSEDYIGEKIQLIESSNSFLDGKIDKLAPYLLKALRENYQSSNSSSQMTLKIKKNKEKEEQQLQTFIQQEKELERQYKSYIAEYIDSVISQMPIKQLDKLKEVFEQKMNLEGNGVVVLRYQKEGFNNKIVKAHFREFIRINYAILLTDLKAYNEYRAELNEKTITKA